MNSYKRKMSLTVRDDLPRFTSAVISIPNCSDVDTTLAPPMKRISLPYQVLPNGNIIASQILKIDIQWSACDSMWTGATVAASSGISVVRRIVLDAVQNPILVAGQMVACDLPTNPEYLYAPYTNPSVLGYWDRVQCRATQGTVAAASVGYYMPSPQNESHVFSTCGDYPIIPSGGVYCYGFWTSNNDTGLTAEQMFRDRSSIANTNPGYRDMFTAPVSPNFPNPTTGWNVDNIDPQPYATIRLWYRVVELTPFQHLMIVQKYTNKVGQSSDENYEKLKNTGTAWNPVYPNLQDQLNPNAAGGGNITPWFGS